MRIKSTTWFLILSAVSGPLSATAFAAAKYTKKESEIQATQTGAHQADAAAKDEKQRRPSPPTTCSRASATR